MRAASSERPAESTADGVQPGLQLCGAQHELSDERASVWAKVFLSGIFCVVLN